MEPRVFVVVKGAGDTYTIHGAFDALHEAQEHAIAVRGFVKDVPYHPWGDTKKLGWIKSA